MKTDHRFAMTSYNYGNQNNTADQMLLRAFVNSRDVGSILIIEQSKGPVDVPFF